MIAELVQDGLREYQRRKQFPTEHCVVDGVSCSNRFLAKFNSMLGDDVPAVIALERALKETVKECSHINGITVPEATVTLFLGYFKAMIFGPSLMEDSSAPMCSGNTSSRSQCWGSTYDVVGQTEHYRGVEQWTSESVFSAAAKKLC